MHANTSKGQHQERQYFTAQNRTNPDSRGTSPSASKLPEEETPLKGQKQKSPYIWRFGALKQQQKSKLNGIIQIHSDSNKIRAGSHPIHSIKTRCKTKRGRVHLDGICWDTASRISSAVLLPRKEQQESLRWAKGWLILLPHGPAIPPRTCARHQQALRRQPTSPWDGERCCGPAWLHQGYVTLPTGWIHLHAAPHRLLLSHPGDDGAPTLRHERCEPKRQAEQLTNHPKPTVQH